MKASSDCKTFLSDSSCSLIPALVAGSVAVVASVVACVAPSVSPSAVVPLFPVVGELGFGWVAAEEEGDEASKDGLVMAFCEELGDSLEGHNPPDSLHNEPEIRQRRRTFHIV